MFEQSPLLLPPALFTNAVCATPGRARERPQ
jgi:hypothetical protein